jgi:hypothetical protein
MTETFVHYIWQYQQFDYSKCKLADGTPFKILKTGFHNHNSGPDFLNGILVIDTLEWVGNIEIHIKSSDWNLHKHQHDVAYDTVILHVVWEHDTAIFRKDGSQIPTFELKNAVLPNLIEKYQNLLKSQETIACTPHLNASSELLKIQMLDKALATRLSEKSVFVNTLVKNNLEDWEQTVYQVLAKNFGFKLNADVFLRLSEVLPLKIILKHKNSLFQIESLVFGMAGFLEEEADEYASKLKAEFDFLGTKYQIKDNRLFLHEWRFLRTRPGNFPSIRLAQFAMFLHKQNSFFSKIYELESFDFLKKIFELKQSDYWLKHYQFGKQFSKPMLGMGSASIDNIIINSVVTVLAAYAEAYEAPKFLERAIGFLENIKAENNFITKIWAEKGFEIKSSFDSQALIQQYQHFCLKKRCVNCPIGVSILKK